MIAPAAALGANVLGNMVAAPLLPTRPDRSAPIAGVISGDSTLWQDYGWASSETPGPQVTLRGTVERQSSARIEPVRGEPVPIQYPTAKPRELQPDGRPASTSSTGGATAQGRAQGQAGAERHYNQNVILPTEPEKTNSDKQASSVNAPPPAEDSSAMNQSMLVGAVAGALVAKQTGYNWLLGGAAGALVGHWYALPKAGA